MSLSEKDRRDEREELREVPGLYKGVRVSVRALDIIIVVCVLAILLFVAVDLRDPGFTVSFDSRGGSDVPSQTRMYGELVEQPEPPDREGYAFTGWYRDSACYEPWNMDEDPVESSITLYAGWEEKRH